MAREDDDTREIHIPTTQPLHRANMARTWVLEAAKVWRATGFEAEAESLETLAAIVEGKIGPL